MRRRLANLPLLAVAAGLILYNAPQIETDVRRAVLVLALAAAGVVMNFAGLILPRVRVRPLVRGIACTVALLVAAGFAAAAWSVGSETIDPDAKADPLIGQALELAARRYAWLAAATAYVGLSVLLLPGSGPEAAGDLQRTPDSAARRT